MSGLAISSQAQALAAVVPEAVVKNLHLAVDADRTLTRTDRTVSPATQAAIRAVYAAGGQIHLCTGRQYSVLYDSLLKFFPSTAYHVVAGGAQIVTNTGEVLWEHGLAGDTVLRIIHHAQANGCEYAFGIDKTIYAQTTMHERFRESYGESMIFGDVTKLATVLSTHQVAALFIGKINPGFLAALREFETEISFKEMGGYQGQRYIDIAAKGVNKAAGLNELAQLQHTTVKSIITVGDEQNDLEMIEAGWGVAMGNAIPELKAIAKLTIDHTDNDGLAQFIMALLARKRQLN